MTENTQKEQFSTAYVRALASVSGYKVTREEVDDDSVDITLSATGGAAPKLDIQLKCSSTIKKTGVDFPFVLKLKNYDDLRRKTMVPRILVVLEVPSALKDWLNEMDDHILLRHRSYWMHLLGAEEVTNETKVTIRLPTTQLFTCEKLREMMQRIESSGAL